MLSLRDVHTYYGKAHVLHGVSIDVGPGEVVGLLGRNGVGKSTTLKTVMENLRTGLDRPGLDDGRRQELLDKVYGSFPVLRERRNQAGGTLSGGEQQMLAIRRIRSTVACVSPTLMPAVGSSRHRSVGSVARATPISRLRCSPCERFAASSSSLPSRPTEARTARARSTTSASER